MTDYEIIEMMGWQGRYVVAHEKLFARIKCVVQKAVQTERARCADIARRTVCDVHTPTGVKIYGSRAAKAILGATNADA